MFIGEINLSFKNKMKPSAQLLKHDAEHVLEFPTLIFRRSRSATLLKFGTKAHLKKLRKPMPTFKERTMTVTKLAEVLGLYKGQGITQH
jgi:hypothetical protein